MNVMGIVFTNDASLGELTNKRTMASLPFGGRYRQVDWALSNLSCAAGWASSFRRRKIRFWPSP